MENLSQIYNKPNSQYFYNDKEANKMQNNLEKNIYSMPKNYKQLPKKSLKLNCLISILGI